MKKTAKIVVGSIALAGVLVLVGCNASETVKTVVQNTYSVVKEGDKVIDVITQKLSGSQVWTEISAYVTSLDNALSAIATTLERVAPLVGANLTTLSSVSGVQSTAQLDTATDKLLKSIE